MNERTSAFRLPVLAQVTVSMRRVEPRLAALPHVADLISKYLDASVLLTPAQATARGSTSLLHRVLLRVTQDPAVDEAFRDHWLARAMEVAIEMDSLAMVRQIHAAHPEPLHVRSLRLALQHGTLEMVEWIVENRSDRLCCAPGVRNMCATCLNAALPNWIADHDAEAIMKWLLNCGIELSNLRGPRRNGPPRNVKIVRWMDEQGNLGAESMITSIISHGPPAVETLRYLIEMGHTVSEELLIGALARGCYQRELEPVMDELVASRLCDSIRDKFVWAQTRVGGAKVLQWDAEFLAETRVYGTIPMAQNVAFYAAHFFHVDALKWLWHERGVAPREVPIRKPITEEDLLDFYEWMDRTGVDGWCDEDSVCAARRGYLAVIQWLHEHKPDQLTDRTMETAAAEGHMEIVRWLHSNTTNGCGDYALQFASHNGQLEAVQWLTTNYPYIEGDTTKAMIRAAVEGRLEVLAWLHANREDACGACVLRAVLLQEVPALPSLRWLTANGSRCATCLGHCAPSPPQTNRERLSVPAQALHFGDLAVARFVLDHHRALFTVEPLDFVVRGGHLPAIQWLHAAAPETVNWDLLMETARQTGDEAIATWVESVRGDHGSAE